MRCTGMMDTLWQGILHPRRLANETSVTGRPRCGDQYFSDVARSNCSCSGLSMPFLYSARQA